MAKNQWLEFIAEYKLKYPKMKYADLLAQAADSPEWAKFKKNKKKSLIGGCVEAVKECVSLKEQETVNELANNPVSAQPNDFLELKKEIELLRKEMKKLKQPQ